MNAYSAMSTIKDIVKDAMKEAYNYYNSGDTVYKRDEFERDPTSIYFAEHPELEELWTNVFNECLTAYSFLTEDDE